MARYPLHGIFRDGQGNVIENGTIVVYLAGTTTVATAYEDSTTVDVSTSFTSDSVGHFVLYVDDTDYDYTQLYDVVLSKTGYNSQTYEDVSITGGITDALILFSDITTNDVSATKHGFAPKLSDDDATFLDGKGAYDTVKDTDVAFTDVTTNDASTTTHGFLKKLSNTATQFMNGVGAWSSNTAAAILTAAGDLLYASSANTLQRLAKGTAFYTLRMKSDASVPEWGASATSTLTTAGDILYASDANTLQRLAKGAANTKLFMNAGDTAPEWASGVFVGVISRDLSSASGDVATTGVGFKPKSVIFSSVKSTSSFGIGHDTGATCLVITSTGGLTYTTAGSSILIYHDASNMQTAKIKTMDADGFTITWTKTNSPSGTGYVHYTAFR